jgi:hypothetical protein
VFPRKRAIHRFDIAAVLGAWRCLVNPVATGAKIDFYRDVYPVLKSNCIACHNKTTTKASLNMETPEANPLDEPLGPRPPGRIHGPAYLGDAYAPFSVQNDPNQPNFEVPNIGLADPAEAIRLGNRVALRRSIDKLERNLDREGELGALDQFETQAMTLLTNPQARLAFDLSKEDPRVRDRYGRNRWGRQLLLSRRLVEAGAEIITSSLSGPLCGRVANWDDHAVNHHVFDSIDGSKVLIDDFNGRPTPIVDHGKPIAELIA